MFDHRRTVAAALASLALGATTLAISPTLAGAHDGEPHVGPRLRRPPSSPAPSARSSARRTRQFRDPAVAAAAGYVAEPVCAELPGVGGMGYHWVNHGLVIDGIIDPTKPEVLLFAPAKNGRLELLGVEYMKVDADQDLDTDEDRPTMLGQPLEGPMPGHGGDMPVHYDLHAWVFTHNPSGELATWNPQVSCEVGR